MANPIGATSVAATGGIAPGPDPPGPYPAHMGGDNGERRTASAAILVVPLLAVVAFAVALTSGGDGTATTEAATAPAGQASIEANPTPGAEGAPVSVSKAPPNPAEPAKGSPDSGTPIAWVRSGERIGVFDAPGGERVARQGDETDFGSASVFAVRRRNGRWLGVTTPLLPNGRLGWIRADPGKLRGGAVEYSVRVDLSQRTAKAFHGQRLMRIWPVTVGAAGSETPTGSFAVTDTFRGGLNAAYGCCAVAISATQPDLPSGWLGGNRIAFHGTSGPLGVAASHGCVRSADRDVSFLVNTLPLGTPVQIRR